MLQTVYNEFTFIELYFALEYQMLLRVWFNLKIMTSFLTNFVKDFRVCKLLPSHSSHSLSNVLLNTTF